MRAPLALMAAAVLALMAAGCTSSRAGTPHAASGSASPSVTASASGTPSPSASRPKPLDLTSVDACRLLTEQQLTRFADGPGRPGTSSGDSLLAGSPGCAFDDGAEQTGFLVTASTTIGLPEFLAKARPNPARKTTTIAGFPATEEQSLLSAPERGSGECVVNVDVAEGQLLEVLFSQISATPEKRLPVETLCANARQVAEAALTTLQGG